jgi:ferric-dicitrate binding protein FerR (iron transport regulator)
MEDKMDQTDNLIEAYLLGQLKDGEYQVLTDFIRQNSVNKQYFHNYTRTWSPKDNPEVEHSWEQFKSKLSRTRTINKYFPKKSNVSGIFLRIAAILILGLFFGGLASFIVIKKLNNIENTFVFNAPKGEKSIINLPDSSKIWLNGGTNIRLSKNFGITNRTIILNGEAYFEVAKNKILPFNVIANDINIRVTGTKFNVTAYAEDNLIKTTIKEGTVQITPQDQKSFKKFQLSSNQEAVYNRTSSKMVLKPANVDIVTSWKNNVLIIENERYSEVFKKLENWYGVKITIEGKLDYEPNYTLTIKTESLHDILENIRFITPLKFKIEGDQVHVYFKVKKS